MILLVGLLVMRFPWMECIPQRTLVTKGWPATGKLNILDCTSCLCICDLLPDGLPLLRQWNRRPPASGSSETPGYFVESTCAGVVRGSPRVQFALFPDLQVACPDRLQMGPGGWISQEEGLELCTGIFRAIRTVFQLFLPGAIADGAVLAL